MPPQRLSELSGPFPRPALDHNFRLREELDRVPSLAMQVTQKTFARATERKGRHGRRHTDVDADIAHLRLRAKFPGLRPAAGKKARHISVTTGISKRNRLFQCIDVDQAQGRPENLSSSDVPLRRQLID